MKDRLLLGSTVIAGLAIAAVFAVLHLQIMVDARQKLVDFHYGLNMKTAASQVDSYIQQQRQQLAALASSKSTVNIFSSASKEALDRGESAAVSIITDAENIYYLDPEITRHMGKIGFAGKHMLGISQQGKAAHPRAVKINSQWKILFSQPVFVNGIVAGTILAEMPTSGLRFALGTVDSSLGLLELRQFSSGDRSVVVMALGADSDENPDSESFDTTNPLWKVTFAPSARLLKSIDSSLPPYWLFYTAFACAVLLALGLLFRSRLGQPSLVETIDLNLEENSLPEAEAPAVEKPADPAPETEPETPLDPIEPQQLITPQQPITELEEMPSALEEQLMESLQSAAAGTEQPTIFRMWFSATTIFAASLAPS